MNTTNAAIARKINVVGFKSLSPNIPAIAGVSVATVPEGVTPAPPDTLTLTDGEPGAAAGSDGVPNVSGVNVGFATNTGSFAGVMDGLTVVGHGDGAGATGAFGIVGVYNGALK